MKKLIVWTMALVFAMTVSLAFADDKEAKVIPTPVSPAAKADPLGGGAPVAKPKAKKDKKEKKDKKDKKEEKKEDKKEDKKEEKK